MILGFSEDFTSNVVLDSELTSIPSSGLYVNSGVHPSINIGNLLDFLPKVDFTFETWDNVKTYNSFAISRKRTDIVSFNGKIYQSIQGTNLNNSPDEVDSEYWIETNLDSLRLKTFLEQVKDKVYSDLSLTKRLVNNQYFYDNRNVTEKLLPNDYAAWVLEPKGSDYVTIRVNQMSIQKSGTTPVNLYVVNQGELLDTITLTPSNGKVVFEDTDITFSGKGTFMLAIDSQEVYVGNATVNPLKFNGFVAYTANGIGDAPETADYTYNTYGNGLGLNVSVYLDANVYINNNLDALGNYVRAVFEYMVFQVFYHNSNNRSNRNQRIQMDDQTLLAELKDMQHETIVRKYHREKKRAIEVMERTFDTKLNDHEGLRIKVGSV